MIDRIQYETSGASLRSSTLLQPGQDVEPLEWERTKANMVWKNWEQELRTLDIPGMTYHGCQMAVGYYTYAARGDRNNPQAARSHAIVSNWEVANPDVSPLDTAHEATSVRAFFPVYDGIGFWIGKRRREEGVNHYTFDQEIAIAQASAVGALGMGEAFGTPTVAGQLVYRCIWAPGKAFGQDGEPIPNTTNLSMSALGLEIHEINTPGKEQTAGPRSFRLYGDAHMLPPGSDMAQAYPFSASLAQALLPAWKNITRLLAQPDPPPAETY